MLARIVLALASVPAFDASSDAEVLVVASPVTEQSYDLERRLTREVQRHLAPLSVDRADAKGNLVVNLRIGADGKVEVMNAHGGSTTLRAEVIDRLKDLDLEP
jgi:hypothetical protein